ncbi:MAG: Gfo/Idh/MocA family oxidoreductase [Alishewanella aestuarii]
MAHIVLVGAGQIGSRHLQSLAKLASDNVITVIEPSLVAQNTALQRWNDVVCAHSPSVYWRETISQLPAAVDVVIVATGAASRLEIVKQLRSQLEFRYLILEKVLFQSAAQLSEAQRLLAGAAVFVNCSRRTYPFYRRLQRLLNEEVAVCYEIEGQNWDMACNAIHHIDLWFYLARVTGYRCDVSGLEPRLIASKRNGCYEVMGTILGLAENGSRFSFQCLSTQLDKQYTVTIKTASWQVRINEPQRQYVLTNLKTGVKETGHLHVNIQSQLTADIVSSLLETGACQLTPLDESALIHHAFLAALQLFFQQQNADFDLCPIT